MKPSSSILYRKAAWIVSAMLITAAISGYFMGLRQSSSSGGAARTISLAVSSPERLADAESKQARIATGYADQRRRLDGPNAGWESHLAKLVQPAVGPSALTNVSEADRALALRRRAGRRAFDGAPPVAPHPIAEDSSAVCLACHGEGLAMKDVTAPKMSHEPYASCTQCHVPAAGPRILADQADWLVAPLAENEFIGLAAGSKGARAWPEAPPAIPHGVHMRNDCLSCHGPLGLFGLRTPHPERQACAQCHAAEAGMNQHPFLPAASGSALEPFTADILRR